MQLMAVHISYLQLFIISGALVALRTEGVPLSNSTETDLPLSGSNSTDPIVTLLLGNLNIHDYEPVDNFTLSGDNESLPFDYFMTDGLDYKDLMDNFTTVAEEVTESTTNYVIVFQDEKNPSAPPDLNKTSTAKDLEEKLNKAERIGAIVGGVLAFVVAGIIIAIYFLYKKYHGESNDF